MAINQSFKFKQIRHKTNKITKGLEMIRRQLTRKERAKLERETKRIRGIWRGLGVNIIPERRLNYSLKKADKCVLTA